MKRTFSGSICLVALVIASVFIVPFQHEVGHFLASYFVGYDFNFMIEDQKLLVMHSFGSSYSVYSGGLLGDLISGDQPVFLEGYPFYFWIVSLFGSAFNLLVAVAATACLVLFKPKNILLKSLLMVESMMFLDLTVTVLFPEYFNLTELLFVGNNSSEFLIASSQLNISSGVVKVGAMLISIIIPVVLIKYINSDFSVHNDNKQHENAIDSAVRSRAVRLTKLEG